MRKLLPDSVAGRTLLVLLAGIALSLLTATAMYFSEASEALSFLDDRRVAERIAAISRLIEKTRPDERELALAAVSSPNLKVALAGSGTVPDGGSGSLRSRILAQAVMLQLGNARVRAVRVSYTDASGAGQRSTKPPGMPGMGMPAGEMRRRMERMMGNGAEMRRRMERMMGNGAEMRRRMERMMGNGAEMRRHLARMTVNRPQTGKINASVQLSDRSWLNFSVLLRTPQPFLSSRFILSLSAMLLAIAGLSVWAVRRSTAPLARFARAAERFGVDVKAPRLPETGPREVRLGARAFNRMQGRIRRFVEDRTQTVAAIAHDLGTPITRLRLRAEFVEDETQRKKMLADLQEMENMIAATLSFARDDAASEPRRNTDLVSLLQSACDGVADAGHEVEFEGEGHPPYDCRPVALSRAFTNLIENAAKYGTRARLSLSEETSAVRVRIDDDGPGIPKGSRKDVFKPFRRLEGSRNRDTGGTGLGLTVARSIVRAHGGDITLHDRPGGGLRVEVTLPR